MLADGRCRSSIGRLDSIRRSPCQGRNRGNEPTEVKRQVDESREGGGGMSRWEALQRIVDLLLIALVEYLNEYAMELL